MDATRTIIRRIVTGQCLHEAKGWSELTEKLAALMAKAPTDENSGPVEQGVTVYVDPAHQRMRVDVGDWFGSYDWFEENVAKSFPKFIEIEVTDEAGQPSWEHKKVFP
jgi:hypothetical protein